MTQFGLSIEPITYSQRRSDTLRVMPRMPVISQLRLGGNVIFSDVIQCLNLYYKHISVLSIHIYLSVYLKTDINPF